MSNRGTAKPVTTLYSTVWILVLVALLIVAVVTKPSMKSFDDYLRSDLRDQIANSVANNQTHNVLGALMKVGCTLDVNACVNVLRSQMQVEQTDLYVASLVKVTAGDAKRTCVGAFQNWYCTDFKEKN